MTLEDSLLQSHSQDFHLSVPIHLRHGKLYRSLPVLDQIPLGPAGQSDPELAPDFVVGKDRGFIDASGSVQHIGFPAGLAGNGSPQQEKCQDESSGSFSRSIHGYASFPYSALPPVTDRSSIFP